MERVGTIRTKLELQRAEERLAFRKLLTPEQRDHLLATGMGEGPRSGRRDRSHRMDGRGRMERSGGHQGRRGQESRDDDWGRR